MSCTICFDSGRRTVRLPVNPEEFTIEEAGNNEKYNVLGLGEIVAVRLPGLKSITWSGLFPMNSYEPFVSEYSDPASLVDFFLKLKSTALPTRIIISGEGSLDTNLSVVVDDFSYSERGGEPGDIYYSISLTEYRNYSAKKVSVSKHKVKSTTKIKGTTTPAREKPANKICVGSVVIANGKYWYTSAGSEPHGTFNNFKGKVSRIVSAKYGYHITTMDGGWRGWVAQSQLQASS